RGSLPGDEYEIPRVSTGAVSRARRAIRSIVEMSGSLRPLLRTQKRPVAASAGVEGFDQLGKDVVNVSDDAEIGDREDRGVRVLVDRHDRLRVLHTDQVLHGTRDAGGDVDVGLHRGAGLADLFR